jgi:hypothetical protein
MSDQVEVFLLPLDDGGDCQNSNVPNDPDKAVGTVVCQRQDDGSTVVAVNATLRPDRSYSFYLTCVRLLGVLQTGDEGSCSAKFVFSTGEVGPTYAVDCYEEPPVSGDIYQSATVNIG